MSGLIAREQPEQWEGCKGGAESRTGGAEGLPGCTSEALGARKPGRGRAERRRVSLTPWGIHPLPFASAGRKGVQRPPGPMQSRSPEAPGRREEKCHEEWGQNAAGVSCYAGSTNPLPGRVSPAMIPPYGQARRHIPNRSGAPFLVRRGRRDAGYRADARADGCG
jgi:hypothetical protein